MQGVSRFGTAGAVEGIGHSHWLGGTQGLGHSPQVGGSARAAPATVAAPLALSGFVAPLPGRASSDWQGINSLRRAASEAMPAAPALRPGIPEVDRVGSFREGCSSSRRFLAPDADAGALQLPPRPAASSFEARQNWRVPALAPAVPGEWGSGGQALALSLSLSERAGEGRGLTEELARGGQGQAQVSGSAVWDVQRQGNSTLQHHAPGGAGCMSRGPHVTDVLKGRTDVQRQGNSALQTLQRCNSSSRDGAGAARAAAADAGAAVGAGVAAGGAGDGFHPPSSAFTLISDALASQRSESGSFSHPHSPSLTDGPLGATARASSGNIIAPPTPAPLRSDAHYGSAQCGSAQHGSARTQGVPLSHHTHPAGSGHPSHTASHQVPGGILVCPPSQLLQQAAHGVDHLADALLPSEPRAILRRLKKASDTGRHCAAGSERAVFPVTSVGGARDWESSQVEISLSECPRPTGLVPFSPERSRDGPLFSGGLREPTAWEGSGVGLSVAVSGRPRCSTTAATEHDSGQQTVPGSK